MRHIRHIRHMNHNGIASTGGMTITMERVKDVYAIGYAKCSSLDNFCKKTGRELSAQRLGTYPVAVTIDDVSAFLAEQHYPGALTDEGAEKVLKNLEITDVRVDVIFAVAENLVYKLIHK